MCCFVGWVIGGQSIAMYIADNVLVLTVLLTSIAFSFFYLLVLSFSLSV